MIVEGKITDYKQGKPWESKHGKKFGNYIKVDAFKDGEEQILVNSKTENPDFLQVGKTIKVDANEGDYGWYGKRITDNNFSGGAKKGGYKKPTLSLTDAKRMCKSNALHVMNEVNSAYNQERIKSSDLASIIKFSMGDIKGDIDKFGEEDSLLTSRLSSLNQACATSHWKSLETVEDVLSLARKYYEYIIK